jgi:hypothetical protein
VVVVELERWSDGLFPTIRCSGCIFDGAPDMALDGSPNPWTLHEGMPVDAGAKYIVTKWYRERQFA